MNERRRFPRHQVSEEVFGRVKATIPARILDISPHGAQIELASALRPAVECDLWLPTKDGQLRIKATVRRCRAAGLRSDGHAGREMVFRAGLEFLGLSPGEQDALLRSYPLAAPEAGGGEAPPVPRRGPVKIRLNVEHVRRLIETSSVE